MMSYQQLVKPFILNQEDDRIERRATDPVLSKIFNPYVFDKMVNLVGVDRPIDNPPLRSYDPAIHQDLAFYVHQLKGSNFILQSRLGQLEKKAINLINLLRKEYRIKD